MNQRGVIYFYYKLGLENKDIHEHLLDVYGDDAVSEKTVEYWTHQFKLGRTDIKDAPRPGRPREESYRIFVQVQIEKDPYITARQIAKNTNISISTVLNILTNELGYNYRYLRWVPHILSNEMKLQRVIQSKEILKALQTAKRSHFTNILSGDESWFLYTTYPKGRWVLEGEDPGERLKPTHYQKKTMVTIFIKKNGSFFVELLPQGQKFNSKYFIDIIIPLIDNLAYPDGWVKGQKKCLVHFDNAPSHKSKLTTNELAKFPFRILPNPKYSPDISPLDFGIFGTVKSKMPNESISSEEVLKEIIESILIDLGPTFIKSVFEAWEERLQHVINNNGDFIK